MLVLALVLFEIDLKVQAFKKENKDMPSAAGYCVTANRLQAAEGKEQEEVSLGGFHRGRLKPHWGFCTREAIQ